MLLADGQIREYRNPLDLVRDTGLTLEDILLANKGKKKPVKSRGKFTVFDIKGHLIGFQYYPEKDQKKKKIIKSRQQLSPGGAIITPGDQTSRKNDYKATRDKNCCISCSGNLRTFICVFQE